MIGIFAAVLYDVMTGPSGLLSLHRLARDNQGSRRIIDSLDRQGDELALQKRRLQTDSSYLEAVVRRELGMAKPGEKVYRFLDRPKPQP